MAITSGAIRLRRPKLGFGKAGTVLGGMAIGAPLGAAAGFAPLPALAAVMLGGFMIASLLAPGLSVAALVAAQPWEDMLSFGPLSATKGLAVFALGIFCLAVLRPGTKLVVSRPVIIVALFEMALLFSWMISPDIVSGTTKMVRYLGFALLF